MAGEQTLIYYINAYTTLISAALGVCFSIEAVIKEKGSSQTNALYMFARSLALTCAAVIPVCRNAPTIFGIVIKSKMRTVGPFIMAVCHAVCLLLSI